MNTIEGRNTANSTFSIKEPTFMIINNDYFLKSNYELEILFNID